MVKDTLGIEECIGMSRAKTTKETHRKNSRGYCCIWLGRVYLRTCKEHNLKINIKKSEAYAINRAIIESFRKISDIRGTWLSSK